MERLWEQRRLQWPSGRINQIALVVAATNCLLGLVTLGMDLLWGIPLRVPASTYQGAHEAAALLVGVAFLSCAGLALWRRHRLATQAWQEFPLITTAILLLLGSLVLRRGSALLSSASVPAGLALNAAGAALDAAAWGTGVLGLLTGERIAS